MQIQNKPFGTQMPIEIVFYLCYNNKTNKPTKEGAMTLNKCEPSVRYAVRAVRKKEYTKFLLAYDHRLFYVVSGEMSVIFKDRAVSLSSGSLVIFPPATPYELSFGDGVEIIIINFDFQDDENRQPPKAPTEERLFRREDVFSFFSPAPFEDIFTLDGAFSIGELLSEVCREFRPQSKYCREIASAIMKAVILKCAKKKENAQPNEKIPPLAKKIKDYIDHSCLEREMSNSEIAEKFNYHPYYVSNVFRDAFGISLHGYIIRARINRAKELLTCTDMPISEIASICGFSGVSYFSECFRRETGMRPTELRLSVM